MKANQKIMTAKNDRAEVGVGTLIVFIAMVLVAAVAAAVLINTSGSLQQRAGQTGKEATAEVSSNLKVEGIYGQRAFSTAGAGALESTITNLSIHVALQAGAVPIDLAEMIVRYSDGTNVREMNFSNSDTDVLYNSSSMRTAQFTLSELRDDDNSFSTTSPVVSSGDLVKLSIWNVGLSVRTPVQITLIPEAGAKIPADFVTPPTYGTKANIVLR